MYNNEFAGDVTSLRPITLLDVLQKMVMSIVVQRVTAVCSTQTVLRGFNSSVLPGTSTDAVINAVMGALEQALTLERSLRRLKFPADFINFYMRNVIYARTSTALTVYGETPSFPCERGLPQGGSECPLLWRVVYDTVLVEVAESEPGFCLRADWSVRIGGELDQSLEQTLTGVAYVDDTVWLARTPHDLRNTLRTIDEFNTLTNIISNARKGRVMLVNCMADPQDPFVINGAVVPVLRPSEGMRHLGVWLSAKGEDKVGWTSVQQPLMDAVKIMSSKRLTARQTCYILNAVVVPQMLYRTKGYVPSAAQCAKAQQSMRALVKRSLGVSRDTKTVLIEHPDLIGLSKFEDSIVQQGVTELIIALNEPGLPGNIARIRLLTLQGRLGLSELPVAHPTAERVHGSLSYYGPLLRHMHTRGLAIDDASSIGKMQGGTVPLARLLPWPLWQSARPSLLRANIHFVSQVLHPQRQRVRTWHEVKAAFGWALAQPAPRQWRQVAQWASRCLPLPGVPNSLTFPHVPVYRNSVAVFWSAGRVHGGMARHVVGRQGAQLLTLAHLIPVLPRPRGRQQRWIVCRGCEDDAHVLNGCCSRLIAQAAVRWIAATEIENSLVTVTPYEQLGVSARTAHRYWRASRAGLPPAADADDDTAGRLRLLFTGAVTISQVAGPDIQEDEAYTDGSLTPYEADSGCPALCGASAVFADFAVTTALPPAAASSTKSELWALLLAVTAHPPDRPLTIHTDSQAAIDAWQHQTKPGASARVRVRGTCSREWAAIRSAIQRRTGKVTLRKVKAHVGILGNEQADQLAKEAAVGPMADLRHDPHIDTPFTLTCRGVRIEGDPRKFLRRQATARASTLLAHDIRRHLDIDTLDWTATRLALHGGRSPATRWTSPAHNAQTAFRIKLLSDTLPTRARVHRFWPHRQHGSDCTRCGRNVDETKEHIWRCPTAQPAFAETTDDASAAAARWCTRHTRLSAAQAAELAIALTTATSAFPNRWVLAAGCVPRLYCDVINEHGRRHLQDGLPAHIVRMIAAKYIDKLASAMREKIWLARCRETGADGPLNPPGDAQPVPQPAAIAPAPPRRPRARVRTARRAGDLGECPLCLAGLDIHPNHRPCLCLLEARDVDANDVLSSYKLKAAADFQLAATDRLITGRDRVYLADGAICNGR
ncbi:hypothetical protein RI367_006949 [Sorochytrium milnesiophthora]